MLKSKFKENLSWIFFGNIAHAVLSFFINIIIGNILSKEDYGLINYASSIIMLFECFATLGTNNVISKFFTDNDEKNRLYIKNALLMRIISSVITIITLFVIIMFVEQFDFKIILIFLLQSFTMVFSICDILVYWFRFKDKSNIVAIARLVAFAICSIFKILSVVVFKNLFLFALSLSLESLCLLLILLLIYRRNNKFKTNISKDIIKEIFKYSRPFIISSMMISIYAQTDKFMIEKMIGLEEVANYSIALTIAGIVSVLASAIIEGFRTEIFKMATIDKENSYRRLRQLYCIIFWICILYGVFITLLSKQILTILYGDKYINVSNILSLIVWNTSFSYFGSINNMFMVLENKQKYVQISTLFGAILNLILNIFFIKLFGTFGAALASLLTQFFANFVFLAIIKDLRIIFKNIVKGIIFKF